MGLAHFERGREFYDFELKRMGITRSPEELIANFENKLSEMAELLISILDNSPRLYNQLAEPMAPKMTPEEIMAFTREGSAANFPALSPDVTYTLKTITDGMRDFAPAFYLVPQIDYYRDSVIYYNEEHNDPDELYRIMAHEGFPGHLLQKVSLFSGDLHNIRKSSSFTAYSEGWGYYAELYSIDFIKANKDLRTLQKIDRELSLDLSFRVDLGINYEGWTFEEMSDYLNDSILFSDFPDEVKEQLFFTTLKNPMLPVPYSAGKYEIDSLIRHYQFHLGRGFSEKLFHEEFLKRGEAPYYLIRKWMDRALLGTDGNTPVLLSAMYLSGPLATIPSINAGGGE